jgi:hypothetical protein
VRAEVLATEGHRLRRLRLLRLSDDNSPPMAVLPPGSIDGTGAAANLDEPAPTFSTEA